MPWNRSLFCCAVESIICSSSSSLELGLWNLSAIGRVGEAPVADRERTAARMFLPLSAASRSSLALRKECESLPAGVLALGVRGESRDGTLAWVEKSATQLQSTTSVEIARISTDSAAELRKNAEVPKPAHVGLARCIAEIGSSTMSKECPKHWGL